MTTNNNDTNHYSAEDIGRYWQGKMSQQEMHALEEAAMDDPFLADALEGYSTAQPQNISSDIQELKQRLHERAAGSRSIPIKRNNRWWRIAAALILLCGASVLTYKLLMQQDAREMAQKQTTKAPAASQEETTATLQQSDSIQETTQANNGSLKLYDSAGNKAEGNAGKSLANDLQAATSTVPENIAKPSAKDEDDRDAFSKASRARSLPDVSGYRQKDTPLPSAIALAKEQEKKDSISMAYNHAGRDADRLQRRADEMNNARTNRDLNNQFSVNNFSGRVVDRHNNAIPFASVRVNNNNQVASTNNEGVFQIRSTDTALDLSVASVGYEPRSLNLRANEPQEVVLERAAASKKMQEVVVKETPQAKNKYASGSASDLKVYVMDAQPVIGWDEYKTYLQKNRRTDSAVNALKGEVVVAFWVGRNGKLSGFTVEKSLGKIRDAEAIRLIQEGPEWKLLKGRRTRARVIVEF